MANNYTTDMAGLLHMKNHNGMWLPDGDTFFPTRGDYEHLDYRVVKPYWRDHLCAIDIGAHCGYWTKRLVNDFQKVIAFEPMPQHFECLIANVPQPNADLHNIGLSNTTGELYMERHIHNSGMSRIVDYVTDHVVPVDTLDNQLDPAQQIDFIKIDAENHEIFVLGGATNTLTKWKPVLFVEILSRADRRIHDFLQPLGYQCVQIFERNYIWIYR